MLLRPFMLTLALLFLSGCQPLSTEVSSDEELPVLVVEIIASGANIAGANGMHFGPDGMLYVASVVGSNITVVDPDTGEVIKVYDKNDGVIGPDDIAFAADGSFYWTSILTGEVAGRDVSGKKIMVAQLSPGVNPITFSDDGRMFVSQCFLGSNLYELDPAGVQAPRLINDTLGPACGLNGMDWGPDSRLYGPRWFNSEVVSFDVDSGEMRVEATGFGTPAAIKFDSQGVLHVLDTSRGEVVRVADGRKTVIAQLSPGLDNLAFDENDNLFVSSFADGFVARINPDGTNRLLQPGGMAHSGGITISGEQIILADLSAIRGYEQATGKTTLIQRNVVGVGTMGGAMNISADGANLILTSWFDGDARVWDPVAKKRLEHFPGLSAPVAAVRYAGQITVAEHGKQRVVAFDGNSETVFATGLPAPTGLLVEGGNLYVSDRSLGQILLIGKDGAPLATPEVIVDRLTTPEGFVMTPEGLVVIEADLGQVVAVNAAGDRRVLAKIPKGSQAMSADQPPSQVFNGIAINKAGQLFVPGETNHSLYRITY